MIIPHYSTLSQWANSLVGDYEREDIPRLMNEDDWQEWGKRLMDVSEFASKGAPSPFLYQNWQSWAKDVYLVLGPSTNKKKKKM